MTENLGGEVQEFNSKKGKNTHSPPTQTEHDRNNKSRDMEKNLRDLWILEIKTTDGKFARLTSTTNYKTATLVFTPGSSGSSSTKVKLSNSNYY